VTLDRAHDDEEFLFRRRFDSANHILACLAGEDRLERRQPLKNFTRGLRRIGFASKGELSNVINALQRRIRVFFLDRIARAQNSDIAGSNTQARRAISVLKDHAVDENFLVRFQLDDEAGHAPIASSGPLRPRMIFWLMSTNGSASKVRALSDINFPV